MTVDIKTLSIIQTQPWICSKGNAITKESKNSHFNCSKCNHKHSNLTKTHCQSHTQSQSINYTNRNLIKYLSLSPESHILTMIKGISSSIVRMKVKMISNFTSINTRQKSSKQDFLVIRKKNMKVAILPI